MGKIKVLNPDVIGQIAAGEIVERPASIVKELLENALDAEPTRIEIEIEGGGIEKITIFDDGHGMDQEDAILALKRHSTSKISSLLDLDKIQTYGFRGEALASIASVSKLELLTCEPGALNGTRIVMEGSEIKQIKPAGTPKGTRITVQNLFFNVPARRKFLKSVATEEGACLDAIGKIALCRTDVSFRVKKQNKILYALSAGETLKERYVKLFPATDKNQLFDLEIPGESFRVYGLVGAPSLCKSSRSSIFFYANKRGVRPGVFTQAILDGYSGYLPAGKSPVVVLFFEIDGKWIDVNVHPAKAEVRFSHTKEVYSFIEKSIALKLREIQEETRPQFSSGSLPQHGFVVSEAGNGGSQGIIKTSPIYESATLFENRAPYVIEQKEEARFLTTLAKTYAVFQENTTLFLVDLHVAHERINYDLLESHLQNGGGLAQQLLTPLVLPLSASQLTLLSKYEPFLRKTGLDCEPFGETNLLVRAVPAGLEKLKKKELLTSFIDRLEKIDEVKGPEGTDRKILATLACRSSIQAGDDVSNLEIQSLFEKIFKSSNPYFCPHGRPIIVKLTLEELHRLFRRTWS